MNNTLLEKLKQTFPDAVTETIKTVNGHKQIEYALKQEFLDELTNNVDFSNDKERYELCFPGKKYAKWQARTAINKALKPKKEDSKDWDNTQNIYIEGDNIHALKLLKETYKNKVKMIYIDPPYNTGSDGFVYNDDFSVDYQQYLQEVGELNENGEKLVETTRDLLKGRKHAGWLAFMLPRLILARELLKEDGVIFISIDDNEQANLKLICDEVFGLGNFEGHIHWRRRSNQPNDKTKMIGLVAEHIICYSRNNIFLKSKGVGKIALTGNFSNPDNDLKGAWASKPWKVGSDQNGSKYKITLPSGEVRDGEWMGDEETYQKLLSENRIYFSSQNSLPRKKYYEKDRIDEGQCATNWWDHKNFGNNQEANNLMTELMEGRKNIFSNPKSTILLSNLSNIGR